MWLPATVLGAAVRYQVEVGPSGAVDAARWPRGAEPLDGEPPASFVDVSVRSDVNNFEK